MSYWLDLDEYREEALAGELEMRGNERARGVCDYCHRRPSTRPCKFPDRHNDQRIADIPACAPCAGTGRDGDVGRCGTCGGKGLAT